MGSASSKVAKGAARKYPARAPGGAVPTSGATRPPNAGRAPRSSRRGSKPEDARADGMDPDFSSGDFSQRLQQMGVAQPAPTYSPSSTAAPFPGPQPPTGPLYANARKNPTLAALEARKRIQQAAEEDFAALGRADSPGRRYLDTRAVVDAMKLRGAGMGDGEIEKRLGMQPGLLERLGRPGALSHVTASSSS